MDVSKLTSVDITSTGITDISALSGAPLKELYMGPTGIADLTPLTGMQIEVLYFFPYSVTKGIEVVREMKSIKKIARGERYISHRLAEKLAGYISTGGEKVLHEGLSDREFSVFRMIASGKTIKEIADELSLSIKTIHTYRTRVLDKMEMKTNSELTSYALSNGLLTLES